MVGLMNRSIDIMEDLAIKHENPFNLNRRGYGFYTNNPGTTVYGENVHERTLVRNYLPDEMTLCLHLDLDMHAFS